MDRRGFSRNMAGVAGALALAGAGMPGRARAQDDAPVEGRNYQVLPRPVQVPNDGKLLVIEFFWYACPHCFLFEPMLQAWLAKQPADVRFRRVPVGFDARKQLHQRIYYTWEALGLVDQMHWKTFTRFHVHKKPIDTLDDLLLFARESGLDPAKVEAAWRGFSTDVKCKEANGLTDAYGIEYTPEMAIAGRYVVLAQPTRGVTGVLGTTDWLIDRVRQHR
jgi:thiol:disulfide interchange protein DsbA